MALAELLGCGVRYDDALLAVLPGGGDRCADTSGASLYGLRERLAGRSVIGQERIVQTPTSVRCADWLRRAAGSASLCFGRGAGRRVAHRRYRGDHPNRL